MKNLKINVLAIILIMLASCTHDDDVKLEDNSSVALKNQSTNVQMPYVDSNGILFFNDQAHIDQYYEFLGDMVDAEQENPNANNLDIDTILDQFEAQYSGFTSFRKTFNQQYNFNNQGYSKQQIVSIFENTFIKGLEKSIFNEYHELGIGNKIYVYLSEDIAVAFDKNEQSILNELRGTPKGTDDLPATILATHYQEIELISDNTSLGTMMHLDVDYNLAYDSYPILQNEDCDVFNKALGMNLTETIKNDEGAIESTSTYAYEFANITIDWGDGSTPTVSNYSTYSGDLLWHTYTSVGTFYATVTIGFYDLNGDYQTMSDPKTVIVESACSEANGTVTDTANDSSWLLVGELIVSNGFFGSSRIEGTSNAFKKDGGSWVRASRRKHKPYLKVYVSGIFRDANCTVKDHKEGTAQSTHANEKIKIKSKLWNSYDHSNGDIYSEHRLQKGDTYLSIDLVYNPC
ncbi:hypothetical protein U8527_13220 [Kordia algicida OT-1]|uniref:PKD domain-containing protein n=1 Tax=Kordia algicida OT-1 TaxID=391587 RepID=A9E5E5_9FLAO|nr:hypothetical protein [Kordia algicida]EDP95171.1 hypothetical protein KAOT1_06797 [Kordia algicida OT-1]